MSEAISGNLPRGEVALHYAPCGLRTAILAERTQVTFWPHERIGRRAATAFCSGLRTAILAERTQPPFWRNEPNFSRCRTARDRYSTDRSPPCAARMVAARILTPRKRQGQVRRFTV